MQARVLQPSEDADGVIWLTYGDRLPQREVFQIKSARLEATVSFRPFDDRPFDDRPFDDRPVTTRIFRLIQCLVGQLDEALRRAE